MKTAATISRYLLGFMFLVFGLNGFLHFIPQPPLASPLAGQYMTVMMASGAFTAIFVVEVIVGVLLLADRYVALALTVLAALLFNILLFHVTMNPEGIAPGLVAAILWVVLFLQHRSAFNGILQAKA